LFAGALSETSSRVPRSVLEKSFLFTQEYVP